MTENFVSAAELMGRVLGVPGFKFVTIDHPVSSASSEHLLAMAQRTVQSGIPLVLRAQ